MDLTQAGRDREEPGLADLSWVGLNQRSQWTYRSYQSASWQCVRISVFRVRSRFPVLQSWYTFSLWYDSARWCRASNSKAVWSGSCLHYHTNGWSIQDSNHLTIRVSYITSTLAWPCPMTQHTPPYQPTGTEHRQPPHLQTPNYPQSPALIIIIGILPYLGDIENLHLLLESRVILHHCCSRSPKHLKIADSESWENNFIDLPPTYIRT